MSEDERDGSSFSAWLLVRMYGALTAVALLLVVASFAFEGIINESTAQAVVGLWVLVTVYALISRWLGR